MSKGIGEWGLTNALKNMNDEDINDNFVGVLPLTLRINLLTMQLWHLKKRKYPCVIANTDSSENEETQWWSILIVEAKQDIFFFDSFGLDGLKQFIIQDDGNVIVWDTKNG